MADKQERVARLMEQAARLAMKVLERAYEEVSFDYVLLSEQIASNYAPVVGPWTFRAACERAHRLVIEQGHGHGVRWVVFQSYGNATALVPEAMAMACNVYWAGDTELSRTSYPGLRRQYPALGLIGSIDVGPLQKDIRTIWREVRRIVLPLVTERDYLPLLDGRRTSRRSRRYVARAPSRDSPPEWIGRIVVMDDTWADRSVRLPHSNLAGWIGIPACPRHAPSVQLRQCKREALRRR